MCSDGLIVHGNFNSQLLTNTNEGSTSWKHCRANLEEKRSIASQYSLSTTDVFSGVLEILGEVGLMQKRITFDSMQSSFLENSDKRNSEILKTSCQHVERHISNLIKSEDLCDCDIQNHHHLVNCFPMTARERDQVRERLARAEDATMVNPEDLMDLQDAVGEDIEEAIGERSCYAESALREPCLKCHADVPSAYKL